MGKPSGGSAATPPPAVDPLALANAQSQASQQAAQQQATLNNVNTYSPFGSSLYGQAGPGQPFTLNQSLNPAQQGVFNAQTNLATILANQGQTTANYGAATAPAGWDIINRATSTLGGVQPTTGITFDGLTQLPSSASDFNSAIKQAQDAAYGAQTQYLDPQFQQKGSDLTQQLADQGISAGSDAFDRAQGNLGRQENQAYQSARMASILAGNQEQQALFGENLQSRQQGANERIQQYQLPVNALASLLGTGQGLIGGATSSLAGLGGLGNFAGTGTVPTMGGSPTSVQPSNVIGAANAANTANANRFAAGNQLNTQLFNGLGSLGGALGGSNLLFGSQGLGGALGIDASTGILGGLFGGGAGAAAGGSGLADIFGSLGTAVGPLAFL